MAYELYESISLTFIRRHCIHIACAAEAVGLEEVAARFWALAGETRREIDARDEAEVHVTRAQALERVRLVDAHESVRRLSSRAYLLADNDARRLPYSLLFGSTKAARVRDWGARRTEEFIRLVAVKGQDLPELAPQIEAAAEAGEALEKAHQARVDAERSALRFEALRQARRDAVERAMDEAEVAILRQRPGRHDLVRVVLSPYGTAVRPKRQKKAA